MEAKKYIPWEDDVKKIKNQMNELNSLFGKDYFTDMKPKGAHCVNLRSLWFTNDYNHHRLQLIQASNTIKKMGKVFLSLRKKTRSTGELRRIYNELYNEAYWYLYNIS